MIAVFSPRYSLSMMEEVVAENLLCGQISCYGYDDLCDLYDLYRELKPSLTGILFPGPFAKSYFLSEFPECDIPIAYIEQNRALPGIYLLLHMMNEPEIPLQDLFCDFITDVNDYPLYEQVIPKENMPQTLSMTGISGHYFAETAARVTALYREGKIKKAYLTNTNLYAMLQEEKVPCELCVLASVYKENALRGMKEIIGLVLSKRPQLEQVFIVEIDYVGGTGIAGNYTEIEYREATIMKVLVDYKKTSPSQSKLTVNRSYDMIELSAPFRGRGEDVYRMIAPCLDYLKEHCELPFTIGVGVGRDARYSREKALLALRYAKEFGGRCAFGQEEDRVTGPLQEECCATFDTSLLVMTEPISKRFNINNLNYVRLMCLFKQCQDDVTSERIATYLNITNRSANRIIVTLLSNGVIEEIIPDESGQRKKGRPTKHYRLVSGALIRAHAEE